MLHARRDLVKIGTSRVDVAFPGQGNTYEGIEYCSLEESLLGQRLERVIQSAECVLRVEERRHRVFEVFGEVFTGCSCRGVESRLVVLDTDSHDLQTQLLRERCFRHAQLCAFGHGVSCNVRKIVFEPTSGFAKQLEELVRLV